MCVCPPRIKIGVVLCTARMASKTVGPAFGSRQRPLITRRIYSKHTVIVGHGHVSGRVSVAQADHKVAPLPNKHENVRLVLNRLLELLHVTSCTTDSGSDRRRTQVSLTMASTFWTVVFLSLPVKSNNTPREVTLRPLQHDLHQTTVAASTIKQDVLTS